MSRTKSLSSTTLVGVALAVTAWALRRRRARRPTQPASPSGMPSREPVPHVPTTTGAGNPSGGNPRPSGRVEPPHPPTVLQIPPPRADGATTLRVNLRHRGQLYESPARVVARADGATPIELSGGQGHYQGELPPGRYSLQADPQPATTGQMSQASQRGLVGLVRQLEVVGPALAVDLELVAADAPRLGRAQGEVVVVARTNLVVLGFDPPLADAEAGALRSDLAGGAGFEPQHGPLRPGVELRFARTGSLEEPVEAVLATLAEAAARFGIGSERVRTGFVVEDSEGETAVLTDRYVIALAATPNRQTQTSPSQTSPGPADNAEGLAPVLELLGAELVRPLWTPATFLIRIVGGNWISREDQLRRLVAEGVLRYAEAELLAPVQDSAVTLADYTAPTAVRSAHLDHMQLETAWGQTMGAPTVRLASLDRGLVGASAHVAGANLVALPTLAAIEADPGVSHGMEVYSLLAGTGLDGCWGVAPNVMHVVGKLGSYFDVAYWNALRGLVIDGGASVICLSHEGGWGAHLSLGIETLHQLADLNVVIVAAAGNRGKRISALTPSSRPDCNGRATPDPRWTDHPLAAHPRVITVGLTELQNGAELSWLADAPLIGGSNRGDTVDCCVYADGVTTATGAAPTAATGTSMAAPIVAATAALMRSVNPALNAVQIRSLLCRSADVVAPTSPCQAIPGSIELKDYVRNGTVVRPWDPAVSVHSHHLEFGWGRLNIGRAVRYAQTYPNPPNPW